MNLATRHMINTDLLNALRLARQVDDSVLTILKPGGKLTLEELATRTDHRHEVLQRSAARLRRLGLITARQPVGLTELGREFVDRAGL